MRDPNEGDREPPRRSPDDQSAVGHTMGMHNPSEVVRLRATAPGPLPRRVAAFVIDSVLEGVVSLLYIVLAIIQTLLLVFAGTLDPEEVSGMVETVGTVDAEFTVLVMALGFFYRWATQTVFGFTVGKRVLGLRLIGPDGRQAKPLQILKREVTLTVLLGIVPLVIHTVIDISVGAGSTGLSAANVLSYVLLAMTLLIVAVRRPDRCSFHDLIGETQVLRAVSTDSPVSTGTDFGLILRRAKAYAIDVFISVLLVIAVGRALGGPALIFGAVFVVLNRGFAQMLFGFTIGKRVAGLRIAQPDGRQAGPMRIIVREIVLLVLLYMANLVVVLTGWYSSTILLALILVYFAIHRTDNRSLHDLVAGTCVVRWSTIRSAEMSSHTEAPQV